MTKTSLVEKPKRCESFQKHDPKQGSKLRSTSNRPGRIEIIRQEPNGELHIGLPATAVDPLRGDPVPWRL